MTAVPSHLTEDEEKFRDDAILMVADRLLEKGGLVTEGTDFPFEGWLLSQIAVRVGNQLTMARRNTKPKESDYDPPPRAPDPDPAYAPVPSPGAFSKDEVDRMGASVEQSIHETEEGARDSIGRNF